MISTSSYKELTVQNIFSQISSYDIFKYYLPDFKNLNTSFLSPLRDDKNPGVRIFKTKSGDFMYKDFAKPEHTFSGIGFVMELYGLDFVGALQKINDDFHLNLGTNYKPTSRKPEIASKEFIDSINPSKQIMVVSKPLNWYNSMYFYRYNITEKTLKHFKVKPLQGYYIDYQYFPCKVQTFGYSFGNYLYKILQLGVERDQKWISNTPADCIQGWDQLPEKGDICIITSSLKDVMVLYEIGYPAVAPQSETPVLPQHIIDSLKSRFAHVVILYNNDEPGKKAAAKLSQSTGFPYAYIPNVYPEKDPSDFSKEHGLEKLEIIIDSII